MPANRKPFALRPEEPRNPRAWLGVAALVRAKRFPIWNFPLDGFGLVPFSNGFALEVAKECQEKPDSEFEHHWRRVFLPMLLEEAKKRGLNVR